MDGVPFPAGLVDGAAEDAPAEDAAAADDAVAEDAVVAELQNFPKMTINQLIKKYGIVCMVLLVLKSDNIEESSSLPNSIDVTSFRRCTTQHF